jgi:hypothetical protein
METLVPCRNCSPAASAKLHSKTRYPCRRWRLLLQLWATGLPKTAAGPNHPVVSCSVQSRVAKSKAVAVSCLRTCVSTTTSQAPLRLWRLWAKPATKPHVQRCCNGLEKLLDRRIFLEATLCLLSLLLSVWQSDLATQGPRKCSRASVSSPLLHCSSLSKSLGVAFAAASRVPEKSQPHDA